jgi:hypothetical protein
VALKPERGGINDAVAILGLKKRTVEAMALRGELPGVAKMAHRWTFDLDLLRTHVQDEVNRRRRSRYRARWYSKKYGSDAKRTPKQARYELESAGETSDGFRYLRLA